MSESVTRSARPQHPRLYEMVVLIAVFVTGVFVVGFEQGHIANLAHGSGLDPMFLHELTHDMRHAAGFPCH